MDKRYDVIVMGAGPAGRAAAILTRRHGASVLVIEEGGFGGTCPLRGCIPKKVLVSATDALHCICQAHLQCISAQDVRLDWGALIRRKNEIISSVPEITVRRLEGLGIDTLTGRARFTGKNTVAAGGREFQGSRIVIATGSRPRSLPIPGIEHAASSTDLLNMETLPSSIIFIGGGAIAMEFSHVLTRAGSKVVILVELSRGMGIDIRTGISVESIEKTREGLEVSFSQEGEKETLRAEMVATGLAGSRTSIPSASTTRGSPGTGRASSWTNISEVSPLPTSSWPETR
jgi:glutathione reductase (NADPH)